VNLVLVGYRGTGKSSIARALGSALGRAVVSVDVEIVTMAGMAIPDVVAKNGWSHFRDLEEQICKEVGARDGVVIDCGGGVVEREANFEALRANGVVFWLKASVPTIVRRIHRSADRPSLTGTKSFTEEAEEVLARRAPLYARLAHVEIDTDGRAVRDIASDVAERFWRAAAG
jgi:shikimate kinase